jgi:integrase
VLAPLSGPSCRIASRGICAGARQAGRARLRHGTWPDAEPPECAPGAAQGAREGEAEPRGAEPVGLNDLRDSFVALALDARMSLAEVAVLARHANARVTGQLYAGLSDKAKTQLASKLLDAGVGAMP